MGVVRRTAERGTAFARTWLFRQLVARMPTESLARSSYPLLQNTFATSGASSRSNVRGGSVGTTILRGFVTNGMKTF